MIEFIVSAQSDLMVIIIFTTLAVLMMVAFHAIFRPILKIFINMNSHLAFSIHDTIAATLGAMIAFAMVEAMSDYNTISTIVRTEASQINSLDRLLTRYGDHKFEHIRKDLILYSQSIVDDEWPELYFGRRSEKTQEAWAPISRGTVNIEPTNQREALLYADIIKLVDEISKTRDDRIGSSSMKIPFVFWLSISLLFFAKNLLSSCYKGSQEEDFALGVQTAVLAALVAVTFILNEHYIGQTSISPDPIKETILLMKNRTH